MIPETFLEKFTSVDVRCKDSNGRQFLVEMQMNWTTAFKQRVLFNASKAYVTQTEKGFEYSNLKACVCTQSYQSKLFARQS
jgi:predicted transposase/invertase (TIGR01784 family)